VETRQSRCDNSSVNVSLKQTLLLAALLSVPNATHWYASPDWWLVIFAGLTGGAIIYQATEMKRATEAMKESTKLQEIGLRQWVDEENWEIRSTEFVGYGRQGRTISGKPDKVTINITFDIVNSSPRPLTIQKVEANIHIAGRKDWESVVSDDKRLLAPEQKHPVILPVPLIGDEIDRYILNELMVSISGQIFYADGLGKSNEQTIGNVATCGVSGARFMRYTGKTPTGHVFKDSN
jgi:hypothetical protein